MNALFEIVPPSFMALVAAMIAGYLIKRAGLLPQSASRPLMVRVQKFVTPAVLILSFWGLEIKSLSYIALAFAGIFVIGLQMSMAAVVVRVLKLQGSACGSFMIAAALSNIGYLGWVINLQLFGKQGYDYSFIYGFYFTFAVYVIAYPIAARYSTHDAFKALPFTKRIFVEGILVNAIAAMSIGIALNLLRVERPEALGKLNVIVVTSATAAMMFAAGVSVRLRAFRQHLKPSLAMAAIKLVATPILMAAILSCFPGIDPLASKVVIVESMMPMAISCLTVSAIFHLDQDLMNAMWVTSTVLFFAIFQIALILLHLR